MQNLGSPYLKYGIKGNQDKNGMGRIKPGGWGGVGSLPSEPIGWKPGKSGKKVGRPGMLFGFPGWPGKLEFGKPGKNGEYGKGRKPAGDMGWPVLFPKPG